MLTRGLAAIAATGEAVPRERQRGTSDRASSRNPPRCPLAALETRCQTGSSTPNDEEPMFLLPTRVGTHVGLPSLALSLSTGSFACIVSRRGFSIKQFVPTRAKTTAWQSLI